MSSAFTILPGLVFSFLVVMSPTVLTKFSWNRRQKKKKKKKGSRIEDGTVGKCEWQRSGSHRGDTNGPVSVPHFTFLRLHTQSLKEEHKQVWTLAFPTHGSELPNRVGLPEWEAALKGAKMFRFWASPCTCTENCFSNWDTREQGEIMTLQQRTPIPLVTSHYM